MKKKLLSVLLALVLVCSFSMVTAVPVAGATTADQEAAVIAAADRLVGVQNTDGGWPWKAPPEGLSTTNCQGVTAMGIMEAWKIEAKSEYETALAKAYMFVVDEDPGWIQDPDDWSKWKENPKGVDSFPDVTFLIELANATRSSPSLLNAIETFVPGTTPETITDLARLRWDGRVNHWGATYPDEVGTATAMAEYLRDVVRHPNYDAILPWDLAQAIEAALALDSEYPGQGYGQQALDIAGVVYASVDGAGIYFSSTDDNQNDYILGLAGAIDAYEQLNLHPIEVAAYLDLLLGQQQDGGYWNYHGTTTAEKGVQSTAYAALALFKEGSDNARAAANEATNWLVSTQQFGGWFDDVTPECAITTECYEVNGEAAWALAVIGAVSVELNEAWYRTGDTVYVTVNDPLANGDPIRTEQVVVAAVSTTDTSGITVTLDETDINTGVFKGSFPLVPPPSPPEPTLEEIMVEDDDLITVTYLWATDTARVDDTAPVITIVDVDTPTNVDTQTISGTFLEANPDAITLTVVNGGWSYETFANVDEGAGTWEVVNAPLQEGDNDIVATITDLIGNSATDGASILLDTTAPTGWISIPPYINATTASAVPITIYSNDDAHCAWKITDENAVVVYSDTVDMVADQEITIQYDLSGEPDGDFTAEATFSDDLQNESYSSCTATMDTERPAKPSELTLTDPIYSLNQNNVSITGTGEIDATVDATITDERGNIVQVSGGVDTNGDFSISGIDVSSLVDGLLTASVTVTDAAGNTGDPGTITADKDATSPTVEITTDEPDPTNASPILFTATFTEPVTGFVDSSDINVVNGTITRFGDEHAPVYLFTVVPRADGLVTVSIPPDVAHDAAGNPNWAAEFSITYDSTPPEVAVTSPNGGENWLGGSTHDITWTATDVNFGDTLITIEYSLNGGTNWDTIAADVANTTDVYSWVVPNLSSSNCLVRVTAVDRAGNSGSDVSDSEFTITSDTIAPAVTVNSPNGGEVWQALSAQTITWTATDDKTPPGDLVVELAYSINGGTDWQPIALAFDFNTGAYSWTVPEINSSQCLVVVVVKDTSGNVGSDISNNVFTITTPGAPVNTIELKKTGWNLISLMLIPTSSNITDVLAGIDVVSVWAYDASIEDPTKRWSSYVPGEVPGDLETMVDGKGYWIEMKGPHGDEEEEEEIVTLTIVGKELPDPPASQPAYSVAEGWNLIGFKSTTPRTADSYLLAIDGKYTLVRGYDGSYFTIGAGENLDPGSGYWISVIEPGTIYP